MSVSMTIVLLTATVAAKAPIALTNNTDRRMARFLFIIFIKRKLVSLRRALLYCGQDFLYQLQGFLVAYLIITTAAISLVFFSPTIVTLLPVCKFFVQILPDNECHLLFARVRQKVNYFPSIDFPQLPKSRHIKVMYR